MPRYFFHIMDGRMAIDDVGIVFDSNESVRHEALRATSEMLADREMDLWLGNSWTMTVADEEGFIFCNIRVTMDLPRHPGRRGNSHPRP